MDERRRRIERANNGAKKGTRRRAKNSLGLTLKSRSSGIVIPEVKSVLSKIRLDDREKTSHRTNIIFPSEMARADWCHRATYYRMSGRPEKPGSFSFQLENVFAEGNAIHVKWQNWLSETGKLWGDWKCDFCGTYVKDSVKPPENYFNWVAAACRHNWNYREVTLSSATLPVSGHADGALTGHDCLIEIKSLGLGTVKFDAPKLYEDHLIPHKNRKIPDIEGMWGDLHRPLVSHLKQGNIYLWMAEQMGMPFDRIVFLYEFKANQQVKEFTVKKSDNILAPLLDTAQSIVVALEKGVPPACPKGSCAQCKAYEEK